MGFQIGAKRLQTGGGISNRGKEISNLGRDYKSGQERLQTGAGISNHGRNYKSMWNKVFKVIKGFFLLIVNLTVSSYK